MGHCLVTAHNPVGRLLTARRRLVGGSAVAAPQAAPAGELGVDGGVLGVGPALVFLVSLGGAVVQALEEVFVVTAVHPVACSHN